MPKPRSHYDVLGIKKETAPEEVKSRYREMARTYHPDVRKDHSPEANRFFSEIIEAYRVLSDPLRRSEYDRQLDAEAAASRRMAASSAKVDALRPNQSRQPRPRVRSAPAASGFPPEIGMAGGPHGVTGVPRVADE